MCANDFALPNSLAHTPSPTPRTPQLCPFPFVYSNLFFASLRPEVIPVPFFVLATFATTPKLFLHVFIGAQTFEAIQAGRDGGEAATHPSGWFRLFYVVGASALGAATSWYIYHETKKWVCGQACIAIVS